MHLSRPFNRNPLQRSVVDDIIATQGILAVSHVFLFHVERRVECLIVAGDHPGSHTLLLAVQKLLLSWHCCNHWSLELNSWSFRARVERLLPLIFVKFRGVPVGPERLHRAETASSWATLLMRLPQISRPLQKLKCVTHIWLFDSLLHLF